MYYLESSKVRINNKHWISVDHNLLWILSKYIKMLNLCRLFPTDLFEIFIDIGHYVRDISAYEELVSKLNLLKVSIKLHSFKKLYSLHILSTRKAWNILYLLICHLIYNQEDELKQIAESIESINQNKAPARHIGNYAILEHLGSGAFGSVYKVNFFFDISLQAWEEP